MKKITIAGFVCLLSLVGCSNDSISGEKNILTAKDNSAEVVDLNGKSVQEILALKYDSAVLKCALWSQTGEKVNTEDAPSDSFSVDLKNQTLPETLELKSATENSSIHFKATSPVVSYFAKFEHVGADTVVMAQFSPYITMEYKIESKNLVDGVVRNTSSSDIEVQINENIEMPLLAGTYKVGEGASYSELLTCTIETKIKPEYADQYQSKSVKP